MLARRLLIPLSLCVPLTLPLQAVGKPTSAAPITFAAGQNCWRYTGTADTFRGTFRAGEVVAYSSAGEAIGQDGRRQVVQITPRDMSIFAEGVRRLQTEPGRAILPVAGMYEFTVSSPALQGRRGMVAICRLNGTD